MKKLLVFCLFFLAAAAAFGIDFQTSLGYETMYMFRGQRVVDTPCLMPQVGLTGDNFELKAKSFYNIDKHESFKGEYSLMFKTDAKSFDMSVGLLHHDMLKVENRDTTEFVVSAGWNKWGLAPKATVYFDFVKGSGKFVELGITKQLSSRKDAFALDVNTNYVINNELMGLDKAGTQFSGFYNGELRLRAAIDMGKHMKVYPFVAYSFPLSNDGKWAIERLSMQNKANSFYGGVTLDFIF